MSYQTEEEDDDDEDSITILLSMQLFVLTQLIWSKNFSFICMSFSILLFLIGFLISHLQMQFVNSSCVGLVLYT
jgi:hypothetical protein